MRNLRRRIEVLEKSSQTVQDQRKRIIEGVLSRLDPTVAESLLSAFGAERVGRNLSDTEEAAKHAYLQALLQECPAIGHAGRDLANTLDPRHLVIVAWAHCMSTPELHLVGSAMRATEAGRSVTEEESAAIQAGNKEWLRLWRLAGFHRPVPPEVQE